MRSLESEIEAALEARTGRACVFMPSGRFGLHVAFRLLLSPGDRILMSPIEDDTVFFGALAAGLRPVIAPVSPDDGNLHLDAVSDATWSSLGAVLTGNTYGLPDRVVEARSRCAELGIALIEDAAHALETDVDQRPVGSFGDASVFSLSKHIPGRGGVLSIGDESRRREVVELRDALMAPALARRRVVRLARAAAIASLERLRLERTVERIRGLIDTAGSGSWRIPLRAPELRAACAATDIGSFDSWMQTAYPDYRMQQRPHALESTLAHLHALERDRERRIAGLIRLRELEVVAPAARTGPPLPLLRVPLLVKHRDEVARELRRRRINVHYVYGPALDDYSGPEFSEPSPEPSVGRWWAAHALPIDPYDAERVLDVAHKGEIRLAPPYEPAVFEGAPGR